MKFKASRRKLLPTLVPKGVEFNNIRKCINSAVSGRPDQMQHARNSLNTAMRSFAQIYSQDESRIVHAMYTNQLGQRLHARATVPTDIEAAAATYNFWQRFDSLV